MNPPGLAAAELLGVDDAYVLDVREQVEWDAGHAPDAVHVPMGALGSVVATLPRQGRVLVICRSGNRSRTAAQALRGIGFDAWNVEGGMQAWQSAGGLVVRSDGAAGAVI